VSAIDAFRACRLLFLSGGLWWGGGPVGVVNFSFLSGFEVGEGEEGERYQKT
jgi:hypothetical protein